MAGGVCWNRSLGGMGLLSSSSSSRREEKNRFGANLRSRRGSRREQNRIALL